MRSQNQFALKEWAVVCRALAAGRQSLLLRKGGIHEPGDAFKLAHREFWLFPTYEHQRGDALAESYGDLWQPTIAEQPPAGVLRIGLYAVVEEVYTVTGPTALACLEGLHALSQRTVLDRFHYRVPGLFVVPVRVFALDEPNRLEAKPDFAGCRSWVDLETALATDGIKPVLGDEAFEGQMQALRRELRPTGFA